MKSALLGGNGIHRALIQKITYILNHIEFFEIS